MNGWCFGCRREEDQNSLQRANFFVAVSIPIVVRVVTALVQGYGTVFIHCALARDVTTRTVSLCWCQVPHLFLFGGALSFVSLVEVALVLLYTGSNSPAKLWKWASRLETLLFCIVTPFAIRDQHTSAWSDLYVELVCTISAAPGGFDCCSEAVFLISSSSSHGSW